jgi:DNA polymerase-3 subunit epsilon
MRQIVLDTETTGLELELGHRVIEIGCVELVNRRDTGRHFHRYLCPDREIDDGALRVHGIRREFLLAQPRFAEVAEELLAFLAGAELIMHNAPFDVGFLDMELKRLPGDLRTIAGMCAVLDTLVLARQMHPGQRNSLDALCKRYSVDNSHRELHGALLDAKILAHVYLAMTGGQGALTLGVTPVSGVGASEIVVRAARPAVPLIVLRASAAEIEAHERSLAAIDKASGGQTVWRRWDSVEAGSGGNTAPTLITANTAPAPDAAIPAG